MATSSPWGKSTSWADDSEAAAAAAAPPPPPAPAAPAAAPVADDAFPSLEQASKAGKKKKPQAIPLAEFTAGKYSAPSTRRQSSAAFNDSERLTSEEMLLLPTGPKERTEEELREGGGRGFQNYGRDRDNFRGERGERGDRGDRGDREGSRGFGFEREREASRADDSRDWSMNKPSRGSGGGGGGFRSGGFEDRDRDRESSFSKADEADNWAVGKKFVPSEQRRGSDEFGRGGGGGGKADLDDNWGASKLASAPPPSSGGPGKRSFWRGDDAPGPDGGERWSRNGGGDSDRWGTRGGGGGFGGGEDEGRRPRLNLQPRTIPVDSPPRVPAPVSPAAAAGGGGGDGIRPGTPDEEVKPKRKINPFGDAKPREVLLEERGQDWRKMDQQLENKRPENEEEKKLKQEISNLKELAESTGDPAIKEQVQEKELELEQLSKELDSKARVSVAADRWRKESPPSKAPAENEWRRGAAGAGGGGGGDAWKRGENGRERGGAGGGGDRW